MGEAVNKFGMVLLTFLYSEGRRAMAERSYRSLAASKVDLPLYIVAGDERSAGVAKGLLKGNDVNPMQCYVQPTGVGGPDAALAWITERFFAETDCTHVIELADDIVYHPDWFTELEALVKRHPGAVAWSVYRSAHTRHHRTLRRSLEGDHLVTSMAGNGTCWTREEWVAWGVHWSQGPSWPLPDGNGNTLDLHHAYFRKGERWATDKSYMQHLGTAEGIHTRVGVPEYALNFAGETA